MQIDASTNNNSPPQKVVTSSPQQTHFLTNNLTASHVTQRPIEPSVHLAAGENSNQAHQVVRREEQNSHRESNSKNFQRQPSNNNLSGNGNEANKTQTYSPTNALIYSAQQAIATLSSAFVASNPTAKTNTLTTHRAETKEQPSTKNEQKTKSDNPFFSLKVVQSYLDTIKAYSALSNQRQPFSFTI